MAKLVCKECETVYIMEEKPEKLSLTYCLRCGVLTTLTKYISEIAWRWKHKKVDIKEITISGRIKAVEVKGQTKAFQKS